MKLILRGSLVIITVLLSVTSISAKAKLSIEVAPGQNYSHKYMVLNLTPQMAFWIEDTSGNFLSTMYVTKFSASTFGKTDVKRPAALPVWRHKGMWQKTQKSETSKEIDAVSGATPKTSFEKIWNIPDTLKPGQYNIFAEINCSFDYNDVYKKDLPKSDPNYNDANGQPSVIYKGSIVTGNTPSNTSLAIVGHGSVSGEKGEIISDMTAVTTAKEIVKSIKVTFVP